MRRKLAYALVISILLILIFRQPSSLTKTYFFAITKPEFRLDNKKLIQDE
ncbi:hypothetical protein XA3_03420 [Xylocopilactobacillus apicola]|uniref:Uncharacterized protein n=1 Tax=Xylocopilactobacillus apicola TaxID=2932184 RepID=A0AAU9DHW9_9LACO|nr:hypothetical protein XA3_03420 [Xylocopilactobacillus apicola]